jgi:ATP-binding cassette subfamily C protein
MLSLLNKIRYLLTRREKIFCALIVLMMIIGAGLEVLGIGLVMPVVALLTKPELIEQNKYIHFIYKILQPESNEQFIFTLCILLVVLYFGKNLFLLLMTYCQSKLIYGKAADLSVRLYKSYINAPYTFHLDHNSAGILNNINLIQQVSGGVLLPFLMLITESAVITGIFILLLWFSPSVTIVLAATTSLGVCLLYYPLKNYNYKLGRETRNHSRGIFQSVMQGMEGIKEIKVKHCEKGFIKSFAIHETKHCNSTMLQYFSGQFPRFLIEAFIVAFGMGFVVFFVEFEANSGSAILNISLLTVSLFRLMPSMSRVQYNLSKIRGALCTFDNIYNNITNLDQEQKNNAEPIFFKQHIKLSNITFRYNKEQSNVISNISLEIPVRKSIAIVGATGCGKTTLVDIILGLLKPCTGMVLVDDRCIEENITSWRKLIGYVPQVIYLMDDSIKANVAFGNAEDDIDEQRVIECLKISQVYDFIEELPEGINTFVGEHGLRLSGGQRQRIGIARALYHNPQVLILDEATSALDNDTEKAFVDALNALKGKLTIIIIAHRMTTVENCDEVLKL